MKKLIRILEMLKLVASDNEYLYTHSSLGVCDKEGTKRVLLDFVGDEDGPYYSAETMQLEIPHNYLYSGQCAEDAVKAAIQYIGTENVEFFLLQNEDEDRFTWEKFAGGVDLP